MFYTKEEEILIKKYNSYKESCLRSYKTILTKFLNLREQELLKFVIGKTEGIYLSFSSITENDEMKRAIISPFEDDNDFEISILKVEYNKKFSTLNHRHILGNIMGLQIERNMIGDILINKVNDIYLIIAKEMEDFIKDNLTSIDNTPIKLTRVDTIEGDFTPDYKIHKAFVSSLRVDLIISEGFNISRSEALKLISAKAVKVNQMIEVKAEKNMELNDLISVKGYGRLKVLNIGNASKSGKIFIELGKLK